MISNKDNNELPLSIEEMSGFALPEPSVLDDEGFPR